MTNVESDLNTNCKYNLIMKMSNSNGKRFILTGPPGIGKTTIIKALCSLLQQLNMPVIGFYTEELRRNQRRVGFDVVNINGARGPLARLSEDTQIESKFKVGQYSVLLNEFESMVLPIFQQRDPEKDCVIIIDEIGKMEIFSNKFKEEIQKVFKDEKCIILATIPVTKGRPIPLVESIRNDPRSKLFTVNLTNRNQVPDELLDLITKAN
ncbi:cancer-related nucleoside-triphosphatase homolog [Arctopsyche grandis]|uniref:cancer-related nucleoside-triphosphatase homolog n=1 Tax=Arctopsyche grandis TaxID=121162 RepID=UPI00406D65A4